MRSLRISLKYCLTHALDYLNELVKERCLLQLKFKLFIQEILGELFTTEVTSVNTDTTLEHQGVLGAGNRYETF